MADIYRGWKITYAKSRPATGVYVAESKGVELSAASRVAIERAVDRRIFENPPNGHGITRDVVRAIFQETPINGSAAREIHESLGDTEFDPRGEYYIATTENGKQFLMQKGDNYAKAKRLNSESPWLSTASA